jgi:hypothetical protein
MHDEFECISRIIFFFHNMKPKFVPRPEERLTNVNDHIIVITLGF